MSIWEISRTQILTDTAFIIRLPYDCNKCIVLYCFYLFNFFLEGFRLVRPYLMIQRLSSLTVSTTDQNLIYRCTIKAWVKCQGHEIKDSEHLRDNFWNSRLTKLNNYRTSNWWSCDNTTDLVLKLVQLLYCKKDNSSQVQTIKMQYAVKITQHEF